MTGISYSEDSLLSAACRSVFCQLLSLDDKQSLLARPLVLGAERVK
jgi:hypothetical protein